MDEKKDQTEQISLTVPDDESFANLAEMQIPGRKVTIRRIEPKWAESFLETRSIDNTFGLDYLISEWGGQLHRLTIRDNKGRFIKQFDVPLRSYFVKVRGKEVDEDDLRRGSRTKKDEPETANQANLLAGLIPQSNTQSNDLAGTLEKVLGLFQNSKNNELQMLGSLIAQMAKPAQTQQSPFDQVIQFGQAMQAMQGVFGNIQQVQQPEPDFISQLPGLLGDLIKARSKPQQQTQIQPQKPIPKPIQPTVMPLPQTQPVKSIQPASQKLSEQLAAMKPDEIVDTFQDTFEALAPDKREEVVNNFLDGFEPEDLAQFAAGEQAENDEPTIITENNLNK